MCPKTKKDTEKKKNRKIIIEENRREAGNISPSHHHKYLLSQFHLFKQMSASFSHPKSLSKFEIKNKEKQRKIARTKLIMISS